MAYLYLAAAIIFEIIGTMSMKYSEGFTKVVPSILTVVCSGICFVALAMALKTLPVSNVYAIWAGVGTAIMAVVGMYYFNEPLPMQKVLATSLIVLGVVLLNLGPSGKVIKKDQMAKVEDIEINRLPAKVQVASETERNAG
jgi:small multidrug resistance pump